MNWGTVDVGIEIARGVAAKPALYRTLQKLQDVPFGMALEGFTAADLPFQAE